MEQEGLARRPSLPSLEGLAGTEVPEAELEEEPE
jgi:hypothetical protein